MSRPAIKAVVMGASAGALDALSSVLPALPPDFSLPIMVVVHLPPEKKSILVELLQEKCQVIVREAEDKDLIEGGTVYIAPPDYHLLVEQNGTLSLSSEEPVLFSRPSIDVLFETAADAYGPALLGIILTGANNDGASGLKAISDAGGIALVQHPELAYSSAMPLAAIEACPEAHVLSSSAIATYMQKVAEMGIR